MKLVFFGSGDFALTSFAAMVSAGFAPTLVVTQPPRRRRRRGREEPTAVHRAAETAGIAVWAPSGVNAEESLDVLRARGAELFVVAEYGQILSRAMLEIPAEGTINVHSSLLPRWRGATPIAAAILAGDAETGVTIQRTVYELDAGPVLARTVVPLPADTTTGAFTPVLARIGGELLVEVLRRFAAGDPPIEEAQEHDAATFCRRLKPADAVIDWSAEAPHIERMVRAYHPKPGARTQLLRDPPLGLELRRATVVAGAAPGGAVAAVDKAHFDVGTGNGLLRVLELVPAARKPMEARAFINGYRITAGERLG